MSTICATAIAALCLLGAVLLGMWLRRFLPQHHLSEQSRDTVKLAFGLVATMSALLLGLLVNSAKTSYDTTLVEVMQKSSTYILLDRELEIYGPTAARRELRALAELATAQLMEAQSTVANSAPMLILVVAWLAVIFLGFSLTAPPNATANFSLVASALCATGAFFLILEFGQPFSGLLRISSEPMLHVLREIGK
jgi:hypothetical protein